MSAQAHEKTATQTPTQVRLAKYEKGVPDSSFWTYTNDKVTEPKDGEVTLKLHYISVDPAMRGWMTPMRSYMPPVEINEVMRAFGIGEVTATKNENFQVGDLVHGFTGVQTEVTLDPMMLRKLDEDKGPLEVQMGALGWPGFTGYFGMTDIGNPQEGETVVVSGAAGAVGSVAGQIAKIKGAYVIGIAGGEEKCQHLTEDLGFDVAIDYKKGDVEAQLKAAAPKGISVYFDNVGGEILDIALGMLRYKSRVVLCGGISQYSDFANPTGPGNYLKLVTTSSTMRGYTMKDYLFQIPEAYDQLSTWYKEGKIKTRNHVVEGIENFPEVLQMLFTGKNFGKLMIKV